MLCLFSPATPWKGRRVPRGHTLVAFSRWQSKGACTFPVLSVQLVDGESVT